MKFFKKVGECIKIVALSFYGMRKWLFGIIAFAIGFYFETTEKGLSDNYKDLLKTITIAYYGINVIQKSINKFADPIADFIKSKTKGKK